MAWFEEEVTRKVTVTRYRCDACHNELIRDDVKNCRACKKDLCLVCAVYWYTDPWTGTDNGDYPEIVCKICEKLSLELAEESRQIQEQADEKSDALHAEWLKKCKEKRAWLSEE